MAALGSRPVQIFGADYPTPDGTCIRDYVHVSDLARAHVAALERLVAGEPSNTFNLGNDRGFSVAEVVLAAKKVTGIQIETEVRARRAGDPPELVSDFEEGAKAASLGARV